MKKIKKIILPLSIIGIFYFINLNDTKAFYNDMQIMNISFLAEPPYPIIIAIIVILINILRSFIKYRKNKKRQER